MTNHSKTNNMQQVSNNNNQQQQTVVVVNQQQQPTSLGSSSASAAAAASSTTTSTTSLTNSGGGGPSGVKKELPANGKKTKGRVRIKMEFIHNKLRRYTTFSKRKTGIMKKVSCLFASVNICHCCCNCLFVSLIIIKSTISTSLSQEPLLLTSTKICQTNRMLPVEKTKTKRPLSWPRSLALR